jgi:A/G-specific adenine glycosylase
LSLAGAVLSVAYNLNEAVIDSNVVRVFRRYFGIKTSKEGRRDRNVITIASHYASGKSPRAANLALLDFAALVCSVRKPDHENCPLRTTCYYFNNLTI